MEIPCATRKRIRFAEYLLQKIRTGNAGTLQFEQGIAASAFAKQNAADRLTKPDGSQRRLFVRTADAPFDNNGYILAYAAPNYSEEERRAMTRKQWAIFNLDMVRAGWVASFIIYPSVPGELDLPLLVEEAAFAVTAAFTVNAAGTATEAAAGPRRPPPALLHEGGFLSGSDPSCRPRP